jgi:hypothetical protein
MHTWHALAATCFVGMVTFWAGAVHAADVVVGSVMAVRGAVFRDTSGTQQPLLANAPVNLGDTIVSAAGKAKIALDDGTIISVGENSRVRIAEYEKSAGNTKARLSLVSGALRSLVTKVTPAGKFEIETETAIAAVRGTDWVIEVTSAQTSVAVVEGAVGVSGREGQAQATVVLDTPGQGTDVRRGAAPTPAVKWGAQRFADTLGRATFD